MCQAVLREDFALNEANIIWLTISLILCSIHEMFWKSYNMGPVVRFFNDVFSYLVFLCVLMYSVWNSWNLRNNRTDLEDLAVEIYIFLYVVSTTKKVIMLLARKRHHVLYHELWTVAEILMVMCFLTAFCARVAAAGIARSKGMSDLSRERLDQMPKSVKSQEGKSITGKMKSF
jgi:hypothetical protein